MKKKLTAWQFVYLLAIKAAIIIVAANLLIPCTNFVVDRIYETEHKEAFFDAHYKSEPGIFFNSIFGIEDEKEA